MTRKLMRKMVCRFVYHTKYDPEAFRKIDWNGMVYKFEHEPGGKAIKILNENKVNFARQELVMLEEELGYIKEIMLQLETKHEKWLLDGEVVFRYRDASSIEGKPMMEGPQKGIPIEEWYGYFYNSLTEYKAYMERQLGIAAKGDAGEEKVAEILEKSEFAKYVVHNVVLDIADEGGKTNEIDTFVILPCGVAVLETKNYGGPEQTLVITDGDKWLLYGKRKMKQEKNPAYQNSRHRRATVLTLRKLFGRDIPVFPLIVIGNNQVRLERQSKLAVKNTDEFLPYLRELRSDENLSDDERMAIKRFLEQEDIGANGFSIDSYREQVNHIKEIVREITSYAYINQVGKTFYYKLQRIFSYGFIGLVALLLVAGTLASRNFDDFLALLLGMCLVIAVGAGAIHIVNNIKSKIMGDR